jgi:hypothetical protein
MSGEPRDKGGGDLEIRSVTAEELAKCGALCEKVHGFARNGALRDAIQAFAPFAGLRDGRIVAYASSVTFWPMAHGVAETEEDMKSLLLGAAAAAGDPLTILVPLRSGLFRWALDQGLRAVKPMNVMTRGSYKEPRGSWFPSVLY